MYLLRWYFLLLFIAVFTKAQNVREFRQTKIPYAPKHYVCYKTPQAITIDGYISEPAWEKAQWTDYFEDIEGYLKPAPAWRTQVKMLWDEHYFYFAAELEEPHVWAKLTQRDTVIFYDNDFEIFIDPNGDTHEYFEYEINAFGTEWDLLLTKPYRDQGSAINGFDLHGMKSAVAVHGTINNPNDEDEGWTIEVAIPWSALRDCAHTVLPPQPGQQWRVNFSRVQWRMDIENGGYKKTINPDTGKPYPEDNWVWSPQGFIDMHAPELWGLVQFSDKLAGRGVEPFVPRRDEEIRWALRRLYYNQKTLHLNQGRFSSDIRELELYDVELQHYQWPPLIHHTPNLFEATATSKDGREEWHIRQDGKIWKSGKSD